ncbi:hypothetical protein CMK20_07150 [Candidatus Poribacteria bacterium]|nr:hypothetical protein [Candidatus Poribacteria bacterium]|tara:strand:- start:2639 stop:2896 length:258 start_codon:yes stop_codon:yes gene_type:complete
MTAKNDAQLIETITLLILVNIQSLQCGVLSIDLMIDQVREPSLKKGLQMFVNDRDDENIKDTLNEDLYLKDDCQNLVVEGVCMLA